MSVYTPSNGAVALQQPDTFSTFLSQRDLGLQIPINYVTAPGVVLTAACFPHGVYDEAAFTQCFSNLLAVGFGRIDADIFWDPTRSQWSLCPVELGSTAAALTSSASISTSTRATETQLASDSLIDRGVHLTQRDASTSVLPQSSTAVESASALITAHTGLSSATTTAGVTGDNTTITIGPYACSPDANFDLLVSILSDFLEVTELKLNATTVDLTLNLHAAASASDPTGSASAPADDELPGNDQLLSNIISNNASVYLYTYSDLMTQRSNLNTSSGGWFAVDGESQPDAAFFTTTTTNGVVSTSNGWPGKGYLEMERGKRLLVTFGRVDPQMSNYNFSGDEATLFPQNFTGVQRAVSVDSTGDVTDGCFFNPDTTSLSAVNSSWAVTSLSNGSLITDSSLASIFTQARNLTACGISPMLNGTLNNVTADQSFDLYLTFVNYTIWSWGAPSDEPFNSSSSDQFTDFRCAVLNATSGFWQAENCGASHVCACRYDNQPYVWNISDARAPYSDVDLGCDDSSSFDVPRTALENTYLLSRWRDYIKNEGDDDDSGPLLWLDFNDLDYAGCWVIGQNGTCPYDATKESDTREVVVPAVAGVIVFILAILTILVKCAGNRQQARRRRKRADDGWDYEGVPS